MLKEAVEKVIPKRPDDAEPGTVKGQIYEGTTSPTVDFAAQEGGWVLERFFEIVGKNDKPLRMFLERASANDVEILRAHLEQMKYILERSEDDESATKAVLDWSRNASEKTVGKMSTPAVAVVSAIFMGLFARLMSEGILTDDGFQALGLDPSSFKNKLSLAAALLSGGLTGFVHWHIKQKRDAGACDLTYAQPIMERLDNVMQALAAVEAEKRKREEQK